MKKFIAIIVSATLLLTALLPVFAFGWTTPSFAMEAEYNEGDKTITVKYRLRDFAGTESADFRLKFPAAALEMADYEAAEMKDVIIECGMSDDDVFAMQFVDLYYVRQEDCDEDGSATIATITFNVKDAAGDKISLIAYEDSCNMDPDSLSVSIPRETLQVPLNQGNIRVSSGEVVTLTSDELSREEKASVTKVIVAAVIAAVVFIGALAAVVVKYRKKPKEE